MMNNTYTMTIKDGSTMKNFNIYQLLCLLMLVVVIGSMFGQAEEAAAASSYTTSLSFFQGFDLEDGVVDRGVQELLEKGTESPEVIRLVFVLNDIEPEKTPYLFKPETDFHIEYSENADFFNLSSLGDAAFALVESQSFDDITTPNIDELTFFYGSFDIHIDDPKYTLIALTSGDNFFKLGNFHRLQSDVSFDYELVDVDISTVPEPSSFILLGIGIVLAILVGKNFRRKIITFLFIFSLLCGFGNTAWGYPDVNKRWNGDSNACWAATTANLLQHTKWVTDAQRAYDYIIGQSGNTIGSVEKGCRLYLNGVRDQNTNAWLSNKLVSIEPLDRNLNKRLYNLLRAGWGISLAIEGNFLNGVGHVISLREVNLATNHVRVSDSDSDNSDSNYILRDPLSASKWYIENYKYRWKAPTNAYIKRIYAIKPNAPVSVPTRIRDLNTEDLNNHCRNRGYDRAYSDNGTWKCYKDWGYNEWTPYNYAPSLRSVIDMSKACREQNPQYPSTDVWASTNEHGGWDEPYSWKCRVQIGSSSHEIYGPNINDFCRKERYLSSVSNGSLQKPTRYSHTELYERNAGGWRCVGRSTKEWVSAPKESSINFDDACRDQMHNPEAYSNGSWTCLRDVERFKAIFATATTPGSSRTGFSVTVAKSGTGNGAIIAPDVNCGVDCQGGEYQIGSFVDLEAIPDVYSKFVGWKVNGKPVTGAIPISFDPTLTAVFDKKSTKPSITGASPNTLPRVFNWERQWLTIYGQNFRPDSRLVFKIKGTSYTYDNIPEHTQYISSTQIKYYISVGSRVYDWTVEVVNPNGERSNAYNFYVR